MNRSNEFDLAAARRPAAGLVDRLNGIAATLWLWQFRARTRERLARLDDHLLSDIGLDRATREHEIAKPFWRG